MGVATGIDLQALLALRRHVPGSIGPAPWFGALATAGLPQGFVPATPFASPVSTERATA